MECKSDGIDLNSASLTALRKLPEVSMPIAKAIVSRRPFLRPDPDLLLVPGIGPEKLSVILAQNRVCAEPPSLPPPTFDVCVTGDGRVDVNRPGSRPRLAELFGTPTADRIVQGIPYWSLDHVRAEGEPGAGSGRLRRYNDRLCLTPPTIDHEGTRWGWIDAANGGRNDFGGATLICYGLTYPVVWDTEIHEFDHMAGADAVCPVNAPVRDLRPASLTRAVMLRAIDGGLWLAYSDGTRDRIPNEAEFACFADPTFPAYLAWDFVSLPEAERFTWSNDSTIYQCAGGF